MVLKRPLFFYIRLLPAEFPDDLPGPGGHIGGVLDQFDSPQNVVVSVLGVDTTEGGSPSHHLVYQNPQRPEVCSLIMAQLQHDLRGHVLGCPTETVGTPTRLQS